MSKQDIVIFGVGKVTDIVYSNIMEDKDTTLNPVAFCVDKEYQKLKEKFGIPIECFEDIEKKYPINSYKMLIAIGYHEMNGVRAKKCLEAKEKGYELVSYIHSKADVSSTAEIGENTIILNNVSIGPFAKIGNDVCVYNNATVAHHTTIGDHVWITSGSVIGGNTKIGNNCFLGINSTIAHNITIGANNFIGTNAVITKCTEDDAVYIVPDTPKYRLTTKQFMKLFKFN